jgi:hypothetical protein
LFSTYPVHKAELTTVMCAVVRLRALMGRQAERLITNPPIDTTLPPAAADIRKICSTYRHVRHMFHANGSLLEEQSGAGVYIEVNRQPQVTMSKRLPPCTVFQSKLRAIHIHIHVDSQVALQSLVKLQISSKTVRQTVELLRELAVRHTVTFQWASPATRWRTRRQKQAVSLTGSHRWRFVTLERN